MSRVVLSFLIIQSAFFSIESKNLGLAGYDANIANFPHQVSIRDYRSADGHICGGFLYRLNVVITAANCVYDRPIWTLKVYAGSSDRCYGGQILNVQRVQIYPEYDNNNRYHDIAILLLTRQFPESNNIQPIGISAQFDQRGFVSGWGMTSNTDYSFPRGLKYMEIRIDSQGDRGPRLYASPVSGSVGTCRGDNGDPLISITGGNLKKAIGIVSLIQQDPCANNAPTTYTRLSFYENWIKRVVT